MEIHREKNVATYVEFPIVDADGDVVSSAADLDSEIDSYSDDSAPDGYTDCTNEATEIGSTGRYYLSLTQSEMNADYINIQIKTSTAGAKTQHLIINTKLYTELTAIYDKLPTNYIMGSSDQTDKDDEIDAIKAKTDNLPGDPASETNVNANETKIDALNDPTSANIADAVWDESLTAATHNIATSAGRRLRQLGDVVDGSVDDVSPGTTMFDTDLTGYGDDFFNNQLMLFTSGNLAGQVRIINDYTSATGEFCFCTGEAWTEAPANTDEFDVIPDHLHTIDEVADSIWEEPIADHTTSSTFGGKNQKVVPSETIGDYKADVSGLAPASEYDSELTTIQADLDNPSQYKADVSGLATEANATTNKTSIITEIDANESKIDTIDNNVDAILVDTGTTIPGTIAVVQADLDNPEQYKAIIENGDPESIPMQRVFPFMSTREAAPTTCDIAAAVWDEETSAHITTGTYGEVVKFVKQLRERNIKYEYIKATVENATRKVAVDKLDRMIIKIKNDNDSDWSSPVDTKTLYMWYETLGDDNPLYVGESD